jgi:hypothetical protein
MKHSTRFSARPTSFPSDRGEPLRAAGAITDPMQTLDGSAEAVRPRRISIEGSSDRATPENCGFFAGTSLTNA